MLLTFEIVTEKPVWFILFCVLAGAGYSFFLYRKEKLLTEIQPWMKNMLAVFRFLTVTILSFLLLSPLVRSVFREIEKPIVVIAQDHSSSLSAVGDTSSSAKKQYAEAMNRLSDLLSKNYTVKSFSFGDKITDGLDYNFSDRQTDFSQLMEEINVRFANRNLGAVIIASDGLYNKGSSPLNSIGELKVPFYSIALGDTTVHKDLILSKINHNKVAFLGNTFPVEVVVDARQCAGEKAVLTIVKDSLTVFSKNVDLSGNRYHINVPVFLEAKTKGVQHYRAQLSRLNGEINVINNQADFFVEVEENKQRILILANAPHPDLFALKTAIEATQNYDADIKTAKEFDGNSTGYNLIIFHQVPSINLPNAPWMERIQNTDVSLFYILGSQTSVYAFNNLKPGINISQATNRNNEILANPVSDFSLFSVDNEALKYVSGLPPLISPFGNYQPGSNIYSLLNQRIGNINTQQPLLFFNQTSGKKIAVLAGEGIWKWRMKEFADHNNHLIVDDLITKTVQYLSVKEKRSPFRVSYKNNFNENEALVFDAELYNESGELVNDPEVKITITNSEKQSFPFTFSKQGKAYTLNAGLFRVGNYRFKAEVKLGDKIYNESGEFVINALMIENTETVADHQLLYALANKSGGQLFYPGQTEELAKMIEQREDIKSVSYSQKKLEDFIHLKWIFALIILLLSAEWLLRKRSGAY